MQSYLFIYMVPKNMSTLAVLGLLNKGDSLVCVGKKNKAKLGKATAGEKSLRANTKLQKLQSKSTNVSPPQEKKKKLPRSVANCRSYAGSKKACDIHLVFRLKKKPYFYWNNYS